MAAISAEVVEAIAQKIQAQKDAEHAPFLEKMRKYRAKRETPPPLQMTCKTCTEDEQKTMDENFMKQMKRQKKFANLSPHLAQILTATEEGQRQTILPFDLKVKAELEGLG